MKKIGITGQKGFVGSYLFNKISLLKGEFELIPFEKQFFDSDSALASWTGSCDAIVHLASMNRHSDPKVIHDTNLDLTGKLIDALEKSGNTPHVIFSSSTQEERDNLYGQSKRASRQLIKDWCFSKGAAFTGLIIPNVFGPFGKPFYNSVVATFCHQLTHGLEPYIDQDGSLKLIYVDELCEEIIAIIRSEVSEGEYRVKSTSEKKVSEILEQLREYKSKYFENGIFPELPDTYSLNLFNTFRSYINQKSYFPRKLTTHPDQRGVFVEMVKLEQGGQVSFSTTVPGITRGNHFHTRKIERFIVIKGKALIQLRMYNTDEVLNFELDGATPSYVDMATWYSHNIKNIGDEELFTVFWINEFFDPKDPDTFFEIV